MAEQQIFDLSGRTALVTGANRGIGKSTALALATAGANLVLAVRDISSTAALEAEIKAMGRQVVSVKMDVQQLDEALDAFDLAVQKMGVIDILVNNVGGGIGDLAIDVKPDDFDWVMNQNVKSSFFISQKFAKQLIKAKRSGHIINVSSQAGEIALPTESTYCIAKAAVSHMTRCLAIEWGEHDIRVNAVSPTFMTTDGTSEALSDPAFKADTLERIAALHKIGKPQDVAGAIVFLASPAADMITGHNLVIDGGWTIR